MVALASACETLALHFAGAAPGDMAGDMAGPDACVPLTSCPATVTCGHADDGCGGSLDCGPCTINALYEPTANSGDLLSIEGRFGDSATVNFPGGTAVAATPLSSSRLRVAVPAAAGSGLLTVSTNGVTTNAVPFNHASYAFAPQAFRELNEQADYARQSPTLQTLRWGSGGVTTPDRVWIIGGLLKSESPTASVEEARIDGDGALRGFRTLPGALTNARGWNSATRVGNFVYVIGGRNAAFTSEPTIERAPINADGSLGSFSVVPNLSLLTPRYGHQSVVLGGWLYVLGGYSGAWCAPALNLTSVERAPIAADGTLGAFVDAGVTLTTAREAFSVAVSGGFLYAIAGRNQTSVEYAPIAADGTLGPFANAVGTLASAQFGSTGAVIGGKLWLLGGPTQSAVINGDGTIQNFVATGGAGANLDGYGTFIGDYFYTIALRLRRLPLRLQLLRRQLPEQPARAARLGRARRLQQQHQRRQPHRPAQPLRRRGHDQRRLRHRRQPGHRQRRRRGGRHRRRWRAGQLRARSRPGAGHTRAATPPAPSSVTTSTSSAASNRTGHSLTSVEGSAINADGTLGPFQPVAATLTTGGLRTLAILGNGLCVFSSGAAVECAPIATDGTLGSFAVTSAPAVNGGGEMTARPAAAASTASIRRA